MSDLNKILKQNRDEYYGSKYSEHLTGSQKGSITSPERNFNERQQDNFEEKGFWRELDNEDYTKKQTFSKYSLNLFKVRRKKCFKEKN